MKDNRLGEACPPLYKRADATQKELKEYTASGTNVTIPARGCNSERIERMQNVDARVKPVVRDATQKELKV